MKYFVEKISSVALMTCLSISALSLPVAATNVLPTEGTGALAVNLQYKTYGQMTADCAEGEEPGDCRMVVRPELNSKIVRLDLTDEQNVEIPALAGILANELTLDSYQWTRGGVALTSLSKADFNETCEVEGETVSCVNLMAVETGERTQGGSYYRVRLKYNMSADVAEDEPEYLWQKDSFVAYELPTVAQEGYTFLGWYAQEADGAWKKVEKLGVGDFGGYDEVTVQAFWVGLIPGEDGSAQLLFDARGGEVPTMEPGMGAAGTTEAEEAKVDLHAPDTGEASAGEAGARSSHAVLYGAMALGVIIGVGIIIARMKNGHQIGF